MTRAMRPLPGIVLSGSLILIVAACPPPEPEPEPPPVEPPPEVTWEAQLQEIEGSGVTGIARLVRNAEQFRVIISATGLDPGASVPQHVHIEPTCEPAGGILINLDETLTVGGEGPPSEAAYPQADGLGDLEYEASRSLQELESALQAHHGMGIEQLELGNRNVNLHAPDLPPLACGELEEAR
jgi:hypothetical protein